MPRMDGFEAAEQILAQFSVCIMMLTGYTDEAFMQRAESLGICGYVMKPVTAETLLPEVEAAFHKFRQR